MQWANLFAQNPVDTAEAAVWRKNRWSFRPLPAPVWTCSALTNSLKKMLTSQLSTGRLRARSDVISLSWQCMKLPWKLTNSDTYQLGRSRPMCLRMIQSGLVLVHNEGGHRAGANLSRIKARIAVCMAQSLFLHSCVSRASWWRCGTYQQKEQLLSLPARAQLALPCLAQGLLLAGCKCQGHCSAVIRCKCSRSNAAWGHGWAITAKTRVAIHSYKLFA